MDALRKLACVCAAFVLSMVLISQAWAFTPIIERALVYPERAEFLSIVMNDESPDSGVTLTGTGMEERYQFYLVRTDSVGQALRTRLFGSADHAQSMIRASDNSTVILGYTTANSTIDYRLMQITSAGSLANNYDFGGNNTSDWGHVLLEYPAQMLYVAGQVAPGAQGSSDLALLRMNLQGQIDWARVIAEGSDARSLAVANDTTLFLYGTSDSIDAMAGHDFLMVQTDSLGLQATMHSFASPQDEILQKAIRISPDLTVMVGSVREISPVGNWNIFVLATNDGGDLLWSRTYGTAGNDWASSVISTSDRDSGLVISGWIQEPSSLRRHGLLMKISRDGDSLWSVVNGGTQSNEFADVVQDIDHRYHIAGKLNDGEDHGLYVVTEPDPQSDGPHAPRPFTLLAPANGDTVLTDSLIFQWQQALDPDSGDTVRYTMQLSSDTLFNDAQMIGPLDSTSYVWWPDNDDVVRYWRIIAFDQSGLIRFCSDRYRSFRMARPDSTAPFSLLYPDSGTVLTRPSSVFRWQRAADPDVNDSVRYTITFAAGDSLLVFTGLRDTFITISFANNPVIGQAQDVTWYVRAQSYYPPMTRDSREHWSFVSWSAGADDIPFEPLVFSLNPAYPNPFNSATRLRFTLDRTEDVRLDLYAIDGRLVKTLTQGVHSAGIHDVEWDGTADGRAAASGMYLARLITRDRHAVTKLMLLR